MIVLVPAYEPDERLVGLIDELHAQAPDLRVVVVDDGSGPAYEPVFSAVRERGVTVLVDDVHGASVNHGKGHALRLGVRHVIAQHPGHGLVCADSDGQHRVVDVLRVAAAVGTAPDAMVLGARRFTGPVPARSRFGNTVTRGVFRAVSGVAVEDTQTGLRAYPAAMLPWLLTVPGERFEYELELLLRARGAGYRVEEVEIATVYLDHNESSHFRPLVDSVRVVTPLVRFAASGLVSFVLDAVLLVLLQSITGSLLLAVVGARITSGSVNFLLNKVLVFGSTDRHATRSEAARYVGLAAVLVVAGYVLLRGFDAVGVPLLPAKVLTDATLFVVGWAAQRRFVFAGGRRLGHDAHSADVDSGAARVDAALSTRR